MESLSLIEGKKSKSDKFEEVDWFVRRNSGGRRYPDRFALVLFVGSVGVEQFYNLVNHAVGRLSKEHVLDGIGVSSPARRAEDEAHYAGRLIPDFVENLNYD